MLLQFSCSNFRSIKNRIVFSTLASKDTSLSERLIAFKSRKFTKISAIYGANGSGKSNFINALNIARAIILNSVNHQPGMGVVQQPHKLTSVDTPSHFDFQFVTHNTQYEYGFSVKNNRINSEYLYFYPNGRVRKIFSRTEQKFTFGTNYKSKFELALQACKENRLLLSCAANFSPVEEVVNAFLFFSQGMMIYGTKIDEPRQNNWLEISLQKLEKEPLTKREFIRIMQLLGTGVTDIQVKTKQITIQEAPIPEPFKTLTAALGTIQEGLQYNAQVGYPAFQTDLVTEESTGIKKLFEIICPLIDFIKSGAVIVWDEIELGLHEAIVRQLIKWIYIYCPESKAQLIFTTHDTSLLDLKLFRRDQIWFTELKTGDRSTDLYSLIEIKDVRKSENIARGYISGRYGAVPMLNETLSEKLAVEEK